MFRRFSIYTALCLAVNLLSLSLCAAQCPLNKQQLTGRINYRGDTAFIRVAYRYTERTVYLRKATYAAYQRMYADALKYGVKLNIISGTRSFDDQVCKWQSKWSSQSRRLNQREKVLSVLKWSSMPGTSRHHWGTDIDLTSLQPAYFKTRKGQKVYDWLTKNAARYGFYQPFTANRTSGYQEEKWHWSYGPLAKPFLAEYNRRVTCQDIKGFSGSQYAANINVIKNWVLQVNPQCL